MEEKKIVVSVDVGTTTIRCCLFNKEGIMVGAVKDSVPLIYPQPGWVEIDCEKIFQLVVQLIKDALYKFEYNVDNVEYIALTTLRNSFTTWSKSTGKPFHNIITWKDLRADSIVQSLNNSFTLKVLNATSSVIHAITGSSRYLGGSVLKFMNGQVTPRLLWAIENYHSLRDAVEKSDAMFGCVDTWLVYRLTGGSLHVTDIASVSSTALFDPFEKAYCTSISRLFGVSEKLIFPTILPCSGEFGRTTNDIFGLDLPIRSLVSDQGASFYGCGCQKKGSVRLTLGTGTFLSLNTQDKPHASLAGLYPIAGYKEAKGKTIFVAEGNSVDTGPMLDWCRKIGLFENYSDLSSIASSVKDSGGVFFVPAFSGLQVPFNDDRAAAGFVGLKPTTTKAHMVRSVLESFAFRILQLWEVMKEETDVSANSFRVDGGVSQCEFLLQLISDLCMVKLECFANHEMTALGAAQLASVLSGFWTEDQLESQRQVGKTFQPREGVDAQYKSTVQSWKRANERFLKWY